MLELIHSILHVIADKFMEEKKPVMKEVVPVVPLTAKQHRDFLYMMYILLAVVLGLVILFFLFK